MLVVGFVFSQAAFAASPSLVNVGVSTKGKYVTMNARLADGFTGKIVEAIENGVPMTFTYHIELRREVPILVDSLIRSNIVTHAVQYDSLKKAYRFTEKGRGIKRKIITRKKSRYQDLMSTLKDIPVVPIYRLDPEEKYYIRVRADLDIDRFWFPFNYLFFFVPFKDFNTSWSQTSTLAIDPDLIPTEDRTAKSPGGNRKVLNHVIRSFNN